jgi:hypothetical protein
LKAAAQQPPAKVLAKSQDENEATIAEVMKAALRQPPALRAGSAGFESGGFPKQFG